MAGCYGECDKHLVQKMLERIRHRGPDASRIVQGDGFVIGSRALARRLGGEASCVAEENGVVVTADSYILNKRELVNEYLGSGAKPDIADVLLLVEMYRSAGLSMFEMIDGAYAVAIVDGAKLILARDRFGIKPLYHSGTSRNGTYSSEMKSQLVVGPDFEPFPPGKVFSQDQGWRSIGASPVKQASDKEKPEETLRRLLLHSTDQCIENSESVNILLSGGIDSSVVAATASLTSVDINSVCVGTTDSEDIEMARRVAAHLGTNHMERVYELDDLLQAMDEAIYAVESFDYPLVRSSVPNYIATHLFLNRNRVTLVGEGGDEIFAGYSHLQGVKSDSKLRTERMRLLASGHSTGFQRVDRMNASACLDGRMPFMHAGIVDLGLRLGRKDLIGTGPNQHKLVLRKAFEKLLPKEVVWRPKQKFSEGAGSMNMLQKYAEETISDKEFEKERKTLPKGRIRTKEELMYFRRFQKFFHSKSCYDAVGLTDSH